MRQQSDARPKRIGAGDKSAILHLTVVKKPLRRDTLATLDRASVKVASLTVGLTAQRVGEARMGDEGKAVGAGLPTALLSEAGPRVSSQGITASKFVNILPIFALEATREAD